MQDYFCIIIKIILTPETIGSYSKGIGKNADIFPHGNIDSVFPLGNFHMGNSNAIS